MCYCYLDESRVESDGCLTILGSVIVFLDHHECCRAVSVVGSIGWFQFDRLAVKIDCSSVVASLVFLVCLRLDLLRGPVGLTRGRMSLWSAILYFISLPKEPLRLHTIEIDAIQRQQLDLQGGFHLINIHGFCRHAWLYYCIIGRIGARRRWELLVLQNEGMKEGMDEWKSVIEWGGMTTESLWECVDGNGTKE